MQWKSFILFCYAATLDISLKFYYLKTHSMAHKSGFLRHSERILIECVCYCDEIRLRLFHSLFFISGINVCCLLLSFAQWMCLLAKLNCRGKWYPAMAVAVAALAHKTCEPNNFREFYPKPIDCYVQHGTPEFMLLIEFLQDFFSRRTIQCNHIGVEFERRLCIQPFSDCAHCTMHTVQILWCNESIDINIIKLWEFALRLYALHMLASFFTFYSFGSAIWLRRSKCMIRFGQDFLLSEIFLSLLLSLCTV